MHACCCDSSLTQLTAGRVVASTCSAVHALARCLHGLNGARHQVKLPRSLSPAVLFRPAPLLALDVSAVRACPPEGG